MQGMRAPQLPEEVEILKKSGIQMDKVLQIEDLLDSNDGFFAATGITGGTFLEGVHYDREEGVTTHSIVARAATGSIRYIKGHHQLKRPMDFKNRNIEGHLGVEDL
jgi:fructose-1,6-bisphosphatase II